MPKWTLQHLAEYMQQFEKQDNNYPDPGPESVLQGKIVKYCKDRGYPCLSFRQSKKVSTIIVPGWPDCTIALPGARTVYIECKDKDGRLSKDQKMIALMLMQLGHEWYEVRSYKRFLEIMEGKGGR